MSPIRLGLSVKQEEHEGLSSPSMGRRKDGAFSLPAVRQAHRFYIRERTLPFSLSKEMKDHLG